MDVILYLLAYKADQITIFIEVDWICLQLVNDSKGDINE